MNTKTRKQFYERHAKAGRSVRYSIDLDGRNIPNEIAKEKGYSQVQVKMSGVLTPEQSRRIFDILCEREDSATAEPAEPVDPVTNPAGLR
jgi:hypothetical protein